MDKFVIYRCLMCCKHYTAERISFGIFPNEIHCHECEGTATVIYTEPFLEKSEYKITRGTWNEKEKFRRSEARYYKRFGFSDWEINELFGYDLREIKKGKLILTKK